MNLAEQYMSMNESFTVTDNPQRSDTKGDTWIKNDEVRNLGKLLGLKVPKDFTWGSYKSDINGISVDVTADRSKPAIVITVNNQYKERIRIKGTLSDTQIKNLKKKIEKQAKERDEQQNKYSKLSDARSKLAKKGISISGSTITIDDVDLYYKDGKVEASGSIYYDSRIISIKTKGAEKEIDRLLADIKKDLLAKKKKFVDAENKAMKNIKEIKDFYDLKG